MRKKTRFGLGWLAVIMAILLTSIMSGCASKEAYRDYVDALKETQRQYLEAAQKPMVEFSGNCTGPIVLNVRQPIQPMVVQQIKDSEWTGTASAALGVVGGLANTGLQYALMNKGWGNTTTGASYQISNATFQGDALIGNSGNYALLDYKTGTSSNGGFNFTGMPTTTSSVTNPTTTTK